MLLLRRGERLDGFRALTGFPFLGKRITMSSKKLDDDRRRRNSARFWMICVENPSGIYGETEAAQADPAEQARNAGEHLRADGAWFRARKRRDSDPAFAKPGPPPSNYVRILHFR